MMAGAGAGEGLLVWRVTWGRQAGEHRRGLVEDRCRRRTRKGGAVGWRNVPHWHECWTCSLDVRLAEGTSVDVGEDVRVTTG